MSPNPNNHVSFIKPNNATQWKESVRRIQTQEKKPTTGKTGSGARFVFIWVTTIHVHLAEFDIFVTIMDNICVIKCNQSVF